MIYYRGRAIFLDTPCKSQAQMEHTCDGACEHVRVLMTGTGMVQDHIRHLSCIAPITPPVTVTVTATVIVTPCGMHSNCNWNYNYRFDMIRFRFDSSERWKASISVHPTTSISILISVGPYLTLRIAIPELPIFFLIQYDMIFARQCLNESFFIVGRWHSSCFDASDEWYAVTVRDSPSMGYHVPRPNTHEACPRKCTRPPDASGYLGRQLSTSKNEGGNWGGVKKPKPFVNWREC